MREGKEVHFNLVKTPIYKFIKEEIRMNKKAIRIVAVIVVLIAIVIGVFMLKGKDTQEPTIDTSKMAGELNGHLPNMSESETKDVLDTPTTEDQDKVFNTAIDTIKIPEIDSEITVDEDGTAHYTDKDGDEITIEIDQTIKDKTDEELDDDYEEMMQAIRDAAAKGGTSNNSQSGNNSSNNQNNTENNQNNNSNNTNSSNNNSDPDMAEIEQAMIEQLLKDREVAKANGANFGEGDPLSNEAIEEIGSMLVPVD